MNVARPSDGLLSARHTLVLLDLISRRANGCPEQRVLDDLAALAPASRSRARNTIAMLARWKVLDVDERSVRIADPAIRAWSSTIGVLAAKSLAARLETAGPHCLQARAEDGLWLDSMLIPGPDDGLALWLVEFEVAVRRGTRERFWRVSPPHEGVLLGAVRAANRARVRRAVTPAQLEDALARQAESGHEAELWVLDHERRRLSGHPLSDQIRQVSQENVAAGYDIASFSGFTTLHHDLHIEVKSFEDRKRFFWTRNEIDVARELGESYALYLVDPARLSDPNYTPEIIRGPYSALFLAETPAWEVSPTTFECVSTV